MDDQERSARITRLETLLDQVEALPDPAARATAEETLRALLDLYGEGLARLVAHVARLGGEPAVRALAGDELVAYLLLLHGLHPERVEARVAHALESVRPYLRSHGGNAELLGVEDGVARLRLQGSCGGCPSSAMPLERAIEEAVMNAAPDLAGIETEGGAAPASHPAPVTFTPRRPRQQQSTVREQGG